MIDRRSALDSNSIADCRFTGLVKKGLRGGRRRRRGGGGRGLSSAASWKRRCAARSTQPARDRAAAAARVVAAAAAAAMKIWKLIGGSWLGLLQTKTMSNINEEK